MSVQNTGAMDKYWFCSLYSFNSNCESVHLAEGMQIIKLPEFLRPDEYDGDSEYRYGSPWSDEKCVGWGIAVPSCLQSTTRKGEEFDRATELSGDLLSAIRLRRKGMVALGELVHVNLEGLPVVTKFTSASASFTLTKYNRPLRPAYSLDCSDIPEVNRLMLQIRICRTSTGFSALIKALRRFDSAYHGEPEDRLVDQMIAFESLYIGDDKELGYKLALRTAFLLGKKKAKIFSDMKKAYALRGQVVHGNKQVSADKLKETIPETEEYLRQSLRRFLFLMAQGHSLKEIRKRLDENILKNGRVLSLRE